MPHPIGPTGKSIRTLRQRFWSKVTKGDGCWLWTGATNGGDGIRKRGILRVSKLGGTQTAHRVSWFLAHGEHPRDLHVCHTCDNGLCVRPDHLFLGTRSDNMRDMMQKGRGRGQLVQGDPRRGPGFNASVSPLK